jgi:hypothetical protein
MPRKDHPMNSPLLLKSTLVALTILILFSLTKHSAAHDGKGAWRYEPCGKNTKDVLKCIDGLFKSYNGDGANWLEYGPQLCKAVIAHPAEFFTVAQSNPVSYKSWLEALPKNTFHILVSEDSVEAELQKAYLLRLKEMMCSSLQSYGKSNGPHQKQVVELLKVVSTITITTE